MVGGCPRGLPHGGFPKGMKRIGRRGEILRRPSGSGRSRDLRLLEDSQRIKDAVEQKFNYGTAGIRAKNPYEVFTHFV